MVPHSAGGPHRHPVLLSISGRNPLWTVKVRLMVPVLLRKPHAPPQTAGTRAKNSFRTALLVPFADRDYQIRKSVDIRLAIRAVMVHCPQHLLIGVRQS